MTAKIWSPPRLHHDHEVRKVTWLELFYDLVYVATLIQLGDTLSEDITLAGFGRFVVVFIPIWWAWTGITFYMNRFVVDDVWHRLLIFVQICAIAWLGVSVTGAFGDLTVQFALTYAAVRLVLLLLYIRTWRHAPQAKPLTQRYVVAHGIGIVIWVASAFVAAPLNWLLWLLAIGVEIGNVYLPQTRRLQSLLPPDPHHMVERYGIFTIIVLGESFIKTISAGAGTPFNLTAAVFSFFGIGVVFGLWWLYFDDVEEADIKPAHFAPYVWIYAHLPLAIGLTAFGVAAKKLFLAAGDDYVKGHYLLLFCGAMVLVAVSLALIDLATERRDGGLSHHARFLWRLGMATAFGALALLGAGLSPIGFITVAAAILAVQVAAEVLPQAK
ncbi:MAG: hypothetical protein Kow0031_35580 [Anaerolineae bacterium]